MALGKPRDFHDKFSFTVEIDGHQSAAFMKASGLKVVIEKIIHREGGGLFPQKSPGLADIEDVTLERGAALDQDFVLWLELTANSLSGRGVPSPAHERNLDIIVHDRDGSEKVRYRCLRCWIKEWTPGDWDSNSSEKLVESVVIVIGELLVLPQKAAA